MEAATKERELSGELAQLDAELEAIVTDVGGTKADIVAAARSLPPAVAFVGGHPIGGAERGGFGFARPDLFKGRPWIFTPEHERASPALERLFAFSRGLGARPSTMDAVQHDRLVAFLSHLPQLTASALMQVVGDAVGEDGLALAGRGLIDTTRLASSPADIWKEVCATNADEIGSALDALITVLRQLRADLQTGKSIDEVFESANLWRETLLSNKS